MSTKGIAKKCLFSLIMIALALAVACSKKEPSPATENPSSAAADRPSSTGPAAATDQPSSSEAAAAEDGPLTPYDEEVVITTVGITSPDRTYIEGESVDDNFISQFYKEKLNIAYKNKYVVDGAKAGEKLNLAIASDDLPDTFTVGIDQLYKLIRAGQIEDLTDVYNKYASENLRHLAEFKDSVSFIPSKLDGKIYGIPKPNDFANNIALMYVREDWLQKLNLKAPQTIDELLAVARAFVEQDPDGNGQKDTYAIALNKDLGLTLDGIAAAFKAYPKIWTANPDGKLVYGSIQPEMKAALGAMNELYQMGAFDKEFAVKDAPKTYETVAEGKVGISFGPFYEFGNISKSIENVEGADWNAYPIMLNSDGKLKPKALPFTNSWFVVRKGFEHPEAVIKSLNLWYEMWQGSYSQWYNETVTNKYSSTKNTHMNARPDFFDVPDKNLKLGVSFRDAVEADDRSLLQSAEAMQYWDIMKSGTTLGWVYKKIFTESELILLEDYQELQYDQYYNAPTETMISRKATLDKLELETFTKIIMGTSPLSDFDKFVAEWNNLGGNKITDEVNAWYETIQ